MKVTGTTLPKDARAATICREWAADFAAAPINDEREFWQQIAEAFEVGGRVKINDFDRMARSAYAKFDQEPLYRELVPKSEHKRIAEIAEEGRYIWNLLETFYAD